MNSKIRNYRAFNKIDETLNDVWAIKYENDKQLLGIKKDFVSADDCFILEGTGKLDIKKIEMFEGDIVQAINPINLRLSCDEFYGFGYVFFNNKKCTFLCTGFDSYYECNLSGKDFLIVGNVFNNTEVFIGKEKFKLHGMGSRLGADFREWINERVKNKRKVLVEKFVQNVTDKEYNIYIEKMKIKNHFKNIALQKREQRYKKIYYEMKDKMDFVK